MFPYEDSKTVSVCPSVCPHPEKRNHPSFVNMSPTLVIDRSMERSSRVLQHGNQKIWFFFTKKFEIEFDLYFDLCWRAEIVQVGLKMHLYVDIGDASSSLWGSTSSLNDLIPKACPLACSYHSDLIRCNSCSFAGTLLIQKWKERFSLSFDNQGFCFSSCRSYSNTESFTFIYLCIRISICIFLCVH